jgi:hypothetical protein
MNNPEWKIGDLIKFIGDDSAIGIVTEKKEDYNETTYLVVWADGHEPTHERENNQNICVLSR